MPWLVIGALLTLVAEPWSPTTAGATLPVELKVRPLASGLPIDARVRVTALSGTPWPAGRDSTLLSHRYNSYVYFYPDGAAPLRVPPGSYRIEAWHGPEWYPAERIVELTTDSTVTLSLSRMEDMRARKWYSGDTHVHSLHVPIDYPISLEQARREIRAEDVAMAHLLDQSVRFTGGPEPDSDSLSTVYCSIEYRHQTGGHAALLGLRTALGEACCLPPQPSWPMLVDVRDQLAAQGGLFVLSHPHTTSQYDHDDDWPGAGLGRELPVLAALGRLDALDAVAYTNEPDTDWVEWYDLLSSGIDVPLTAGTDGPINWYDVGPPGGWRVYARVDPGPTPLADRWLAALRAGKTFVTSGPLMPRFEVAGIAPGGMLDVPVDTLERPVRFELECALGLSGATLVADGVDIWSCSLQGRSSIDTTITLRTTTPRWLALRVEGVTGHWGLLGLPSVAHSGAVRILRGGARRPLPEACARMWDAVQRFEDFATLQGSWTVPWQLDSLQQRCERAKDVFGQPFTVMPGPFAQLSANLGTTTRVTWSRAADTEPHDRILYELELAPDTTFTSPVCVSTFDTTTTLRLPDEGQGWWWRVHAVDRGGQRCSANNAPRRVEGHNTASASPGAPARAASLHPNPSRGIVRLEGFADDVRIHDLAGRRIAWLGHGIHRAATGFEWDPAAGSAPAPAGTYFARSPSRGVALRLTRLR